MNQAHRPIKAALWLYFWLLLFEGVLRKWVLPQFSDAIFVIRDPLVVVIYLLAWNARIFPLRPATFALGIYATVSIVFAFYSNVPMAVTIFGLRTDFLHLPLVFIMGEVLDHDDVMRFGRWTLLLSIPILLLMWWQFSSPSGAWVNAGASGARGAQLRGAMGRIRPPGPFSFVSGVVAYFALVGSFLAYGWLRRGAYGRGLIWLATLATALAIPISISRSLLFALLVVGAFGAAVVARDLRRVPAYIGPLIAVAAVFALISDSVIGEAYRTRWVESGGATQSGFSTNVLGRMAGEFTEPFEVAVTAPMLGHGIGMGTVAGARLMTGQYTFLLAESELTRIVLELGPILGFAFIAWRLWLALLLVLRSWHWVRTSGDSLAWLLTGATFLAVLDGQWGPSTSLGFAVFGAGRALAAASPAREAGA